jgi:hypothetical protein
MVGTPETVGGCVSVGLLDGASEGDNDGYIEKLGISLGDSLRDKLGMPLVVGASLGAVDG